MTVDNLLQHFKQSIQALNEANETILVAVSGGVDSVVLLDLLHKAGYPLAIAHCNYHLRGEESDADATFVEQLATTYQVPFHLHSVDLKQQMAELKRSTNLQELARTIRFDFLNATAQQQQYGKIAIAHHQQDKIESFLINMSRGSGLNGLVALQAERGTIIRPLLFANKAEILHYAANQQLPWREDRSNAQTDYLRNKFRHQVIPMIEDIQPNFQNRWIQNLEQLKMANDWMMACHQQWVMTNMHVLPQCTRIPIEIIQPFNFFPIFLSLSEYGFNRQQTEEIVEQISVQPYRNRNWKSKTHLAVQERTYLEIRQIEQPFTESYAIMLDHEGEFTFQEVTFKIMAADGDFEATSPHAMIFLDPEIWDNKLILRNRQAGDYIQPTGMQGTQKVKQYLINEKYSRAEKDAVILLAIGAEVLWIVGKRKSRKVVEQTKNAKVLLVLG